MKRLDSRLIVLAVVLWTSSFFSQTTKPEFEVASVKPSKTGNVVRPARVNADGRRFTASNAPLTTLLQFAYRASDGRTLRFSDVRGLPEWANQARYDIEARADTNARRLSTEQVRILAQNLLADRFQLKTHWENLQNVVFLHAQLRSVMFGSTIAARRAGT